MPVYIFSNWNLSVNHTSVNRVRYFKKTFLENGIPVKIITFNPNPLQNLKDGYNGDIDLPIRHRGYMVYLFLKRRKMNLLASILHFFYLLIYQCDILNLSKTFNEHEDEFDFKKYNTVITSVPSYSIIKIGYTLKRKHNIKWIIDYRDPWTFSDQLTENVIMSYFFRLIYRRAELKALKKADLILTVSDSIKSTFPEKFHHKIEVVLNGANTDEMDLTRINNYPKQFGFVYAGTIHKDQIRSTSFFEVFKEFTIDNNLGPDEIKLFFLGSMNSKELLSELHKKNLMAYATVTPRLATDQLYEYMYNASIFLQFRYGSHNKIISSKHSDYLAMQKPILLPESDEGDIKASIIRNKAGYVCNNKEELYFLLQQEYSKFKSKESVRIKRDERFINSISRNSASNKLLNLILKI